MKTTAQQMEFTLKTEKTVKIEPGADLYEADCYRLIPSDTKGAILAGELLGFGCVQAGDCYHPVYVYLDEKDLQASIDLMSPQGYTLER